MTTETILYPSPPLIHVFGERHFLTAPGTTHEFRWWWGGRLFRLLIGPEFYFDGASIPRPFRIWLTAWSLGRWAVLIHDLIYRYAGRMPAGTYQELVGDRWLDVTETIERYTADWLMLGVMRDRPLESTGRPIPAIRREAAYTAIRAGGWRTWNRAEREMAA